MVEYDGGHSSDPCFRRMVHPLAKVEPWDQYREI